MDIKKTTCNSLEIDSKLKPLSELNVEFYDQDINTSLLRFALKRCGKPINLERVRIEPYIMLVAKDGSKVRDYLTIYDDVTGIVSYTLPTDFLKHTGRVVGQVYVYQQDNILVTRTFAFMIKDSLVNEFSAETKLEYIKTFDDLEMIIKHKVIAIEEAIANGEDYVARMVEALDTGKKEIADTVSKATTDIAKVANDTTKKITDTSNTAVATVNAKAKEVTDEIANNQVVKITDVLDYQKQKVTADDGSSLTLSQYDLLNIEDIKNFDGYVTNAANSPTTLSSGFFKRKIRTGYIEVFFSPYSANTMYRNAYHFGNKTWYGWEKIAYQSESATTQKQKITSDNGAPLYDLNSSKDLFTEITAWGNGFFTFYLSAGATNNPTGTTSWLRGTASTYGKNSNVLAYDKDGIMYVVVCANGMWGSWDKTALSSDLQLIKGSNTGWLPLPLLNGMTAATPCFYRFYNTNGIYYLSFKGTLNTISTRDVIIAKLPTDVATKIDRVLTWVGNTSVSASTARFNRWSIETDGVIKFTASSLGTAGESGAWNPLDVTLTL